MSRNFIILTLTFILLALCLKAGIYFAQKKTLWNDEYYSQIATIGSQTYWQILSGRPAEGNNHPLYYLIQKSMCNLFQYQTPQEWLNGNHDFKDPYSQIFLRLSSNLCISLSIALIFYFFSRFYSIGAGLLALTFTFSTFMFWEYWAEARHYALWAFLTTVQFLLILHLTNSPKNNNPKTKFGLIAVHILLACTVIFSLPQILIGSLLFWVWVEKRIKTFLLMTAIPVMICLFYFLKAPHHYPFVFALNPEQLLRENFSRDRINILYIYLFSLLVLLVQTKTKAFQFFNKQDILKALPCLTFTLLILLSAIFILIVFKIKGLHTQQGFAVKSCYFINLAPVAIIASTCFSIQLFRASKANLFILLLIVTSIGYLVSLRVIKNFHYLQNFVTGIVS